MEITEMSDILIRIDERTQNIQTDVGKINGYIEDHEDRIRSLEIQRAKDHGNQGGGSTAQNVATGAGIGAGALFSIGKILGWFKGV